MGGSNLGDSGVVQEPDRSTSSRRATPSKGRSRVDARSIAKFDANSLSGAGSRTVSIAMDISYDQTCYRVYSAKMYSTRRI